MSGRETERRAATHNPAVLIGVSGASASGISIASRKDSGGGLGRCPFFAGAIWEVNVVRSGVGKGAGSDYSRAVLAAISVRPNDFPAIRFLRGR